MVSVEASQILARTQQKGARKGSLVQYRVFMTGSKWGAMAAGRIARHYGASVMVLRRTNRVLISCMPAIHVENGTIM
jgi:hypothetical protein